jgi:hypothetical protein
LADQLEDFTRSRVPPCRLLGKNEVPIHIDLKDSTGRLQQPHFGVGIDFLQLGGQTGRPRLIVSNHAEFNRYAHGDRSLSLVVLRAGES